NLKEALCNRPESFLHIFRDPPTDIFCKVGCKGLGESPCGYECEGLAFLLNGFFKYLQDNLVLVPGTEHLGVKDLPVEGYRPVVMLHDTGIKPPRNFVHVGEGC